MYQVFSGNALIALCDRPRYIKVNPKTRPLIETDSLSDAAGIAVGGKAYNLTGRRVIKDAPEADVREVDGGEIIFENSGKLTRLAGDVAAIEDALCEMDAASGDEEEGE